MQRHAHAISLTCTIVLALSLLLPACGGEEDDAEATATSEQTEATSTPDGNGASDTATATGSADSTATESAATESTSSETPTPDSGTATEVAVTELAVDAGCAINRAWGGSTPSERIELRACESPVEDWTPIQAGGYVTTDVSGQAWLDFVDSQTRESCGRIYVFHDSQLQRSPDLPGGLIVKKNTARWRNECSGLVTIETPSADVELEGTDVIVTYLPDAEMTIVAMLDGQVEAAPFVMLDSPDSAAAATTVGQRQFWFSTPGEDPEGVATRDGNLDARVPHGFENLPGFIDAMGIDSWIATALDVETGDDASTAGIDRPDVALLRGGGGELNSIATQDAILKRIQESEWFDQERALFDEDFDSALITLIGEQSPVKVRELFPIDDTSPGSLATRSLALVISSSDAASRMWASEFVRSLNFIEDDEGDEVREEILIEVAIVAVPPDSALERFNALAAERATLWLQRIPEPPPSDGPVTTTDTSPAEIIRLEHLPNQPTTEDEVRIAVVARDPESGVESIVISLFGDTIETCNATTCVAELGQLDEGTYEYEVVVTNGEDLKEPPFERQFEVVSDQGCQIEEGSEAVVANSGGQGVNVRASPSTSANVVAVVLDGTSVDVDSGPWAGDGFTWWQVSGDFGSGFIIEEFLNGCPNVVG